MTQWRSTHWGEILQPAPLSISLLGSILIISSSTDDFINVFVDPKTSGVGVQNGKIKVDQTKLQLAGTTVPARVSTIFFRQYGPGVTHPPKGFLVCHRLCAQSKEITETIDMTRLSLASASLEQMLPELKKAFGAFTSTLRANFSQLARFFDFVASLLCNRSVERFANDDTAQEADGNANASSRSDVVAKLADISAAASTGVTP
ncbi:hypothetical protein DFH08DRAFT_963166 [Mycena albidolilacea]|uniref:Uncharacterized protein n=1 Tax=Mycena albidolilacea TaxID=1033008 RepID=A0AAD7EMY8_9AGAR|nr:hypothetical protein DFH08DRAFT_963166 [Mycena albidolilacea]